MKTGWGKIASGLLAVSLPLTSLEPAFAQSMVPDGDLGGTPVGPVVEIGPSVLLAGLDLGAVGSAVPFSAASFALTRLRPLPDLPIQSESPRRMAWASRVPAARFSFAAARIKGTANHLQQVLAPISNVHHVAGAVAYQDGLKLEEAMTGERFAPIEGAVSAPAASGLRANEPERPSPSAKEAARSRRRIAVLKGISLGVPALTAVALHVLATRKTPLGGAAAGVAFIVGYLLHDFLRNAVSLAKEKLPPSPPNAGSGLKAKGANEPGLGSLLANAVERFKRRLESATPAEEALTAGIEVIIGGGAVGLFWHTRSWGMILLGLIAVVSAAPRLASTLKPILRKLQKRFSGRKAASDEVAAVSVADQGIHSIAVPIANSIASLDQKEMGLSLLGMSLFTIAVALAVAVLIASEFNQWVLVAAFVLALVGVSAAIIRASKALETNRTNRARLRELAEQLRSRKMAAADRYREHFFKVAGIAGLSYDHVYDLHSGYMGNLQKLTVTFHSLEAYEEARADGRLPEEAEEYPIVYRWYAARGRDPQAVSKIGPRMRARSRGLLPDAVIMTRILLQIPEAEFSPGQYGYRAVPTPRDSAPIMDVKNYLSSQNVPFLSEEAHPDLLIAGLNKEQIEHLAAMPQVRFLNSVPGSL